MRHPVTAYRRALAAWLVLLVSTVGLAPGDAEAAGPGLDRALSDITLKDRLRVTRTDGTTLQGQFAGLLGDTLALAAEPPLRISAGDITRIEVWDSATGRGARWGATTGAITGGSLFGLLGLALSSLDNDAGTVGPVLAFATVGALGGAVAVGAIGAGVGALSSNWVVIYPYEEVREPGVIRPSNRRTRLALDAGLAINNEPDYQSGVFGMRLALLRDLGDHVRMGPALAYYAFESDNFGPPLDPGTTTYRATDPVVNMGLDILVSPRSDGIRPYAVLGPGWYISSDLYLGFHMGTGLRWRHGPGGGDVHLAFERHFSVTGDVSGGVDDFTTLSVGITFGNAKDGHDHTGYDSPGPTP